ncbi:MAG: efflux RND transporter permease subunit [Candidatus Competibacterales bacterium]
MGQLTRHPTASHLLMVLLLVGGVLAMAALTAQIWPDQPESEISVRYRWPGAGPADLERQVIRRVEPVLADIEGMRSLSTVAWRGGGRLRLTFAAGVDIDRVFDEVTQRLDRVSDLPEDVEAPRVEIDSRDETVVRLLVAGPFSIEALKHLAEAIRTDLVNLGLERVNVLTDGRQEIWVTVDSPVLRQLQLTPQDLAETINSATVDLPAGRLSLATSERQVRSVGVDTAPQSLGAIEVKGSNDGQRVRLDDIATVTPGRVPSRFEIRYRDQPALEIDVERARGDDIIQSVELVEAYLANLVPTLPPTLTVQAYDAEADSVRQRLGLLLENGAWGLLLVVTVLFVFLNARVALWVAVGIPVALCAALGVMYAGGQTLNMASLFGLLLVIGIVGDDAIGVGEHAEALHRRGLSPEAAAVVGARQMLLPVTAATLTTVAAFAPLFLVEGRTGLLAQATAWAGIAALLGSWLECFGVLPGHLRHALKGTGSPPAWRRRVDEAFDGFRQGPFRRLVRAALQWRYSVIATAIAALWVVLGLVRGEWVGFVNFPEPESNRVFATLELPVGSERRRTEALLATLQGAYEGAVVALGAEPGAVTVMNYAAVGVTFAKNGARWGESQDYYGTVAIELVDGNRRSFSTRALVAAWHGRLSLPADVVKVEVFSPSEFAASRKPELQLQLKGGDLEAMGGAALEIGALLAGYPGVLNVSDNLTGGAPETVIQLTPRGGALGLTPQTVGRQVRQAVEGAVARTLIRHGEEVKIRVRLPKDATADLGALPLRTPDGATVSLADVATLGEQGGVSYLYKRDGELFGRISAELDPEVTSFGAVMAALKRDGLETIKARYGLTTGLGGELAERRQALSDLTVGTYLALGGIYLILAWFLGSFGQPLVVMAVIPFGAIGAIAGHWLMGIPLNLQSLVTLLGLAGILVNDAIVLVVTVNRRRAEVAWERAIVDGTVDRLRAVLLTSLTTVLGLLPLLFETSRQGQFLTSMAVTIVFGMGVATALVLVLLPALLGVQGDVARGAAWLGWQRQRLGLPSTP